MQRLFRIFEIHGDRRFGDDPAIVREWPFSRHR
jgi:acetyl-CoA carboxylase alpha subunit